MRKNRHVHDGDLEVDEPSEITADVRGSVTVVRGRVDIVGQVDGDVTVQSGKTVIIGTVLGDVHNIGGVVIVRGMVAGSVHGEDDYTTVAAGAVVRDGFTPGLDSVPSTEAEPSLADGSDATDPEPAAPVVEPAAPVVEPAESAAFDDPDRVRVTRVVQEVPVEPAEATDGRNLPSWFPGVAVFVVASAIVVVAGFTLLDRTGRDPAAANTSTLSVESVVVPSELLPPAPTTTATVDTASIDTIGPPVTVSAEVRSVTDQSLAMLGELERAKFMLAPEAFDSDDYTAWYDADNDCQSTRTEVLIEQAVGDVDYDATGCKVEGGTWFDPYSGDVMTVPNAILIDHIIPLRHAHAAGVWDWSNAERTRFVNDLTPGVLSAAKGVLSLDRGAQGPESWRPPPAAWCNYALSWVRTKWRWDLPVFETEVVALEEMLASCLEGSPLEIPDGLLSPVGDRERLG